MVAHADVPHRMLRATLFSSPRHSGTNAVIICMSSRTTHVPPALIRLQQAAQSRESIPQPP